MAVKSQSHFYLPVLGRVPVMLQTLLIAAFLIALSGSAHAQSPYDYGSIEGTSPVPEVAPQAARQSPWQASGEIPRTGTSVDPAVAGASALRPDYVPRFTPDFWKGGSMNTYLEAGVVLTGTLADDLSSKKSQKGDVFTINLDNGYTFGGRQMVPADSKIVGVVVSVTPAKSLTHGMPGRLEISLQTFVLPDGRSTPVFGFIERNPNQEFKEDPAQVKKGPPLAGYANSLRGGANAFVSQVSRRALGMNIYNPGYRMGQDFTMNKGESLPIRLNRRLDIGKLMQEPIPPQGQAQGQGSAALPQGSSVLPATAPSVPGLAGPDYQPPTAPPYRPQTQAAGAPGGQSVPNSNSADPF
jgi:hypothetical protein